MTGYLCPANRREAAEWRQLMLNTVGPGRFINARVPKSPVSNTVPVVADSFTRIGPAWILHVAGTP